MLTDETFERVSLILEQLGAVRGKIKGRSLEFFDDQVARHAKYGQDMFLSSKQQGWLEKIYEEHVGPLDKLEGLVGDDPDATPNRNKLDANTTDLDDEIPF